MDDALEVARLLLEVRGATPAEAPLRLDALRRLLPLHPGPTETFLVVEREAGRLATFRLGDQHRVGLSIPLVAALEDGAAGSGAGMRRSGPVRRGGGSGLRRRRTTRSQTQRVTLVAPA